ncbi:MAG: RidA family protein [SAR324 cluster bacterium]|nr:RidA family protein [SAR324 cluster bacterium]
MEILNPKGWPRPKGYSNGMLAQGKLVFVAGQVGWDETETICSENFAEQVGQSLRNIAAVLAEAGAKPEHITRMTWFITSKEEYGSSLKTIGTYYKEIIGRHFPAMSVIVVAGLIEDGAKVEIEATAVIPH